MESILIQANAKINLGLKILAKRADGYHEIKSTIQSIDLADFLLIRKSKNSQITGSVICPESQNLIFKAGKVMERALNESLPCQIHLQKSIPVAAGLGGGSADAAAVLFALNKLYNLKLSPQQLAEIGIKIGAELPFFFRGGTCNVEGIGEKITPVKIWLPKFFVLFRPHKRVETKKVFELYDKTGKSFWEINKEICPEIEKIKKYFAKFGLKTKLSGSGPTIFCEVNNYKSAEKIAESYPDFNGDIFICRPQKEGLKII